MVFWSCSRKAGGSGGVLAVVCTGSHQTHRHCSDDDDDVIAITTSTVRETSTTRVKFANDAT
jgi:hypothetical protein